MAFGIWSAWIWANDGYDERDGRGRAAVCNDQPQFQNHQRQQQGLLREEC